LLILARGWEKLESRGSLAFIASSEDYTPPDEPVTITFYPTTGNKGAAVTVDLSSLDPNSPHDQLAQLGEEHGIPLEDRFAALCKLRLAHMSDLPTRRKLLEIRLYAMGSYGESVDLSLLTAVCLAPEDAAQSNFYLYEPEIVPQIAELLVLTNDVGDEIRSAALQALDSCARHRRGLNAVTTALGTNVGHGLLMTLLRAVIKSEHSYELVDAVLQHLGLIVGVSTHNNMLLSAGVVPLLLDFTATQNPRRDNYIPRVCGILDQIVFNITQGMSVFSNANGLNIFVHRIKDEIDMDWVLTRSEIVSEDNVLAYAANPLRSFLRNVSRLMSATGGTEGLRNLVDTDLPKSLRRIFENPQRYSDRVFSLSINVMATFVHNEPTSLSILQEMQLPQTLFAKLEESTPRSFEVLAAIPGAVGAVCLNSAGLKYTAEHPKVLTNLIDLAISRDLKDTPSERDYIVTIGTALDELVRHHPSLRAGVQERVFALLPEAIEKAQTYEPETPSDYILDQMSIETPAKEAPTNPHLDRLGKIFRLIEGVFHNTSVCKEFIQQGGVTELLGIADLPCVPIKFGATEAALHLSHVFRIISEQDHILLISSMISSIEEALTQCRRFWQGDELHEAWMRIHRGEASDEDRAEFKRLRGVTIRLTYMSESFLGSAFSHSRIATSLIKALRESKTFVPDIGALHRAAFREHGVLQNSTPTAASLSSVTEGENEAESGAKFLATRLNAILAKFWKCESPRPPSLTAAAIKLLYVRRHPEAAHKAEASALANSIAQILVHHLELAPEGARGTKVDTVAIGLTSVLLFDGEYEVVAWLTRPERAHEGHLNTLLFLAFEKKGGVICLRDAMARLVDSMDEAYAEGKKDDVPTTAGNRVAVMVLASLVASRALLESPQTVSLIGSGNFSPPDVLVKVRHDLFPLVRRIWESKWLPTAPTPLVKYAAKALLTIMEAKAESPASAPAPQPIIPIPAIARAPATADPARVEQLVEMGFDRSAADLALVRARNNVAAAAELILSMPHLFQNLPAAPAPAAGDENAEDSGEAASAQEQDGAEATDATATEASEAPAEEESPMEVDTPDLREALNHLREELKQTLPQRALEILDQAEDLVFDLLPAFEGKGISFLLDQALSVGGDYDSAREGSVSARLRLVVVSLKSSDVVLSDGDLEKAKRLLSVLPFEASPRPRWTPAALLLGELVLINASPVTEVKIGDDPSLPVTKDNAFVLTRVAKACQLIAEDKEASRDDLLSAMRLLVVITRQQSIASECLPVLLTAFSSPSPKLRGCHPLLAMIVRHAFEDKTNLAVVMRKEIHEWMSPARNKVSDVSHFVRQLRQVALRDPTEFVATVDATCTLNDPTPPQSVFHIRSKGITEAAEGSDPFRESPVSPSAKKVMDQLLTELSKAIDQHEESPQAYSGLLMALITEVVGSYIPSKQLFLSSLRTTTVKAKGISTVIDWMCDITLTDIAARGTRTPEALRRLTLSGWAASLMVSLCSDITPTADMKDISEDLVSVRKTVLDALVRAIKDCTNLTDLDARYGRLCALAELVFRLLVSRVSVVQHTPDESGTHMAKTMIEKNFVSTLTAAAGEVDLNYPNVRSVLGSILRALEHL
jgi:E3 ubiquitin-protein ligase HUWE1